MLARPSLLLYINSTVFRLDCSSQLREIARTKNTAIEGVMLGLKTGEKKENFIFIFISFAVSDEDYRIYCREFLHTLFSAESVACVCFDAQELLITIIGHFSISHRDVYSGWNVKDVKVSSLRVDLNITIFELLRLEFFLGQTHGPHC